MSKTAIQEMMSEIQANYPQLFDVYSQLGRSFVNDMHKYLTMEKEQIESAYFCGTQHSIAIHVTKFKYSWEESEAEAKVFFQSNYGTNSN